MIDMAAVALARRDLVIMAKPYGVMCRNCDDSVELFQCESIQDVREMVISTTTLAFKMRKGRQNVK